MKLNHPEGEIRSHMFLIRMIIGVDAGALSITDERLKVGVWRVTFNLLRGLSKLDRKNSYRLYSFGEGIRGIGEIRKRWGGRMNEVRLPQAGWSTLWLPSHLRLFPVDVFLGLAQALPASLSRSIGFIYDVGFLTNPQAYGNSADKLAKQTQQLVNRANHIITISESSKQDIRNSYRIREDRVTVAYPGVDGKFFKRPRLTKPKGEALRTPYFLFVGSLNKAKDLPLALEAFALFLKQTKKPYDFLLIGGDYWPDPNVDQSINRLNIRNYVKQLGVVTDKELAMYYHGATALVTTALHEGFCLPAAEAMACGTPVVALDRGAMKEIVGSGGIIVEKRELKFAITNSSGIKSASTNLANALLNVTDRKTRQRLSKQATQRSTVFRWKTFAKHVLDTINAHKNAN